MCSDQPHGAAPGSAGVVDDRNRERLQECARAHLAICELLESSYLSEQTRRQLHNLKRLLELEISACESASEQQTEK